MISSRLLIALRNLPRYNLLSLKILSPLGNGYSICSDEGDNIVIVYTNFSYLSVNQMYGNIFVEVEGLSWTTARFYTIYINPDHSRVLYQRWYTQAVIGGLQRNFLVSYR